MCTSILHAPVTWYDTTPTGRILNRLSRDCSSLDLAVWSSISSFLDLFFPSFVTLGLVIAIVPAFSPLLPPLFYVFYRVQRYYRASSREMKRMLSISKTPLYNWFGGALPASGLCTIRAYRLQGIFLAETARLCDSSNSLQYVTKAMDRWLGTRFEFIGNVLFFGAAMVAVHSRHTVQPAYLALCLTSTLTVARAINYTLRMYTQAESEMTSVERVLHFASNLPHENYSQYMDMDMDMDMDMSMDMDMDMDMDSEHRYVGKGRPSQMLLGGKVHSSSSSSSSSSIDLDGHVTNALFTAATAATSTMMTTMASDSKKAGVVGATVEFVNVSLRYRAGLPLVLRNVSFRIPAGV
jgi:ABC-type multidrug transport system fused ATPase/permease subunit